MIPQAILDSLTTVQNDATALDAAVAEQTTAGEKLDIATHDKAQADGTVISKAGELAADKAALIALIQTTYPTP